MLVSGKRPAELSGRATIRNRRFVGSVDHRLSSKSRKQLPLRTVSWLVSAQQRCSKSSGLEREQDMTILLPLITEIDQVTGELTRIHQRTFSEQCADWEQN